MPPQPPAGPPAAPAPPARGRSAETAALVTAATGVVGLLLGFFGIPSFVAPPTAPSATRTVTATATATATVTATVTAAPASGGAPSPGAGASPGAGPGAGATANEVPLGDLRPYLGAMEPGSVVMGGKRFDNALHTTCHDAQYSINERYKRLTVTVGLDDDAVAHKPSVVFTGDGKGLKTVAAEINRPREVTIDVTGVAILRISMEGVNCLDGHVSLGDPVLHRD
ncbi:NPCBM/NEW2 domain-containing protein [Streptomyces sp. NBC_01551]|uniref:NPCBM/NEW2 domain-containing protein n=1 Tax=Streptomyces sp. NBC_01551 TaxID=2975876 RepID=UPI002251F6E8|nr:NPCBM/NEW2 domain-containing protein [Streptomyces sp. NBC_01551]MCX4526687.1 NPCBM/NEW2 domain-containing protein [Streptomyces sp. NBC_01551]